MRIASRVALSSNAADMTVVPVVMAVMIVTVLSVEAEVTDCAGDRSLDGCTESHESVGYNDFEGHAEESANSDFDHCREVVGSVDVEDHNGCSLFGGYSVQDGCEGGEACDDWTELSDDPS